MEEKKIISGEAILDQPAPGWPSSWLQMPEWTLGNQPCLAQTRVPSWLRLMSTAQLWGCQVAIIYSTKEQIQPETGGHPDARWCEAGSINGSSALQWDTLWPIRNEVDPYILTWMTSMIYWWGRKARWIEKYITWAQFINCWSKTFIGIHLTSIISLYTYLYKLIWW